MSTKSTIIDANENEIYFDCINQFESDGQTEQELSFDLDKSDIRVDRNDKNMLSFSFHKDSEIFRKLTNLFKVYNDIESMKTNLEQILKTQKAELEILRAATIAANRLQSKVVRYTLDDLTAIQKCTTGKWFFESLLGDHSPYSPAPFDSAEEAIQHFEEIEPFTFGTKEPEPEQTRAERIKTAALELLGRDLTVKEDDGHVHLSHMYPLSTNKSFVYSFPTRDSKESGVLCDSHAVSDFLLEAIQNGQSCTDKEALIKLADRFKIRHEIGISPNEIESVTLDTNGLKKVVFCFKNDRFMWSTVENSTK